MPDINLTTLFDWFDRLVLRVQGALFGPANLRNYAMFGTVLAVTILIEIARRSDWRTRYGSRNFRVDVLYYIFYYSGVYQFLVWAWMYKALSEAFTTHLPWLQLNVISGLSPTIQVLALIVVFDFFHYWNHRLRHALPWLWAFHSIHHSQTTMTMMTTFRFHIVDETVFRILMFIPFQILGFSPLLTIWLWADIVTAWITGAQHADLNWSY
jgi:sterol desaturase/sphingolipid hydroxylase (fatty acid hydroxylase superfamily)